MTENRIPFRSEYLEVVELTRMYLAGFFDEVYEDMDSTLLNEFLTIFTGSSFNFGQPIWIEYGSSAVFDASSTVVPTVEMLDATLETAFQGENLNGYIGMLQSLPPGNVFSTTIFVNQTEAGQTRIVTSSSSSQKRETAIIGGGTAAGAAAVLILAAGLLYYRRQQDDDNDNDAKPKDKKINSSITVAGETYAGWSIDQESEAQPFSSHHYRSDSTFQDSTIHGRIDEEEDSDEASDENNGEEQVSVDMRSYHVRTGINWNSEPSDDIRRSHHVRTRNNWDNEASDENRRSHHTRTKIDWNSEASDDNRRSYHVRTGIDWDSEPRVENKTSHHVRTGINWDEMHSISLS